MTLPRWLSLRRGRAPLIVSIPHAGTEIPPHLDGRFASLWLARRDADWWVDELYAFAVDLGASVITTALSRSVIDVNRDPTGASLYPGQPTTELCPTTTFDGAPLYRDGHAPGPDEIDARRRLYFDPYHLALAHETRRLRDEHGAVVLYDAHSIRSHAPRLFDGELPVFNIGTYDGASCAPELTLAVEAACARSNLSRATNGRFKGGYITRHHGQPGTAVHAVQMELACRGYMAEPSGEPTEDTWPSPFEEDRAAPMAKVLRDVLSACMEFARSR